MIIVYLQLNTIKSGLSSHITFKSEVVLGTSDMTVLPQLHGVSGEAPNRVSSRSNTSKEYRITNDHEYKLKFSLTRSFFRAATK